MVYELQGKVSNDLAVRQCTRWEFAQRPFGALFTVTPAHIEYCPDGKVTLVWARVGVDGYSHS